jgi:hypothetical protein
MLLEKKIRWGNQDEKKTLTHAKNHIVGKSWPYFLILTAQFIKIYFFWVSLHFAVTKLFYHVCVPTSVLGLLFSPLTAAAPHCQVLRWALYESGINVGLLGLMAISVVYKTLFAMKQ